jgi:protein tyrosine phosphatase (PTP) superfamily phosphohydrolase (DUF442 family)
LHLEDSMSDIRQSVPPTDISSTTPVPPPPSERKPGHEQVYRQSLFRIFVVGGIRVAYRQWTRVAANIFHEGSPQAAFIERLGIPLPDRMDLSWIDSTLAVGGRIRPADIPRLRQAGITRVVDVRVEYKDDEAALNAAGIQLLYLPTPDTYPLTIEDLQKGAHWINEQRQQGERVFVHCEHGVGRSVLLAAAALVCEGYTPSEAYTLIASKRWQAAPNRRQSLRLTEFARVEAQREQEQNKARQAR